MQIRQVIRVTTYLILFVGALPVPLMVEVDMS